MLVADFLINLKRRGQYQAAQTVLSDADYTAFANDELRSVIAPKILSLRDNYFSAVKRYSVSGRRYRLPSSCMGGRIYSIMVTDGSSSEYHLNQMPNTDKSASGRRGFYVQQGQFILTGDLPSGTLVVTYPCRIPTMQAVTNKTVTAVGASSITLSAVHAAGTGHIVVRGTSPYRTVSPAVVTDGTNVATDADDTDYTKFAVGDVFLNTNTTSLVPLQEQLCDWLLQRTHMRVLQALGQTDQMQAAGSKLADIEKDVMAFMSPRVQNSPKVIFGMQSAGWRE